LGETARPAAFSVVLEAEDMGRMKGSRDVQETQFLCGFIIKLLLFLAKARKILGFLLKHRDLNTIGSKSNCQAESSRL
jgi:hypothetical protein